MRAAGSVDHVLKGDGGMRASPAKGASPLRSGTSARVRVRSVPIRQPGLRMRTQGASHPCSLST